MKQILKSTLACVKEQTLKLPYGSHHIDIGLNDRGNFNVYYICDPSVEDTEEVVYRLVRPGEELDPGFIHNHYHLKTIHYQNDTWHWFLYDGDKLCGF